MTTKHTQEGTPLRARTMVPRFELDKVISKTDDKMRDMEQRMVEMEEAMHQFRRTEPLDEELKKREEV